jgi:hypothetical protein
MDVSQLEYKKNIDDLFVAAIYPLNQIITTNSINTELLGGSLEIFSDNKRFDGLGIPVGLYLSRKHIDKFEYLPKNKEHNKVLDDTLFNKLIDNIIINNKKKIQTRKNKNTYKNKSKRKI